VALAQPAPQQAPVGVGLFNASQQEAIPLQTSGCNSACNTPIPGTQNLFVGREFFKRDGSPVTPDEGCNNDDEIREAIKSSRWGLVLEELDWNKKQFSVVKPLLIPPMTIPGGPMKGAVIASAYDPNIVFYHGQYWICFECMLSNGARYRDVGTSAGMALFDIKKLAIVPDSVHVVVSGKSSPDNKTFFSASVPTFLVANDRLYIYWSMLTVDEDQSSTNYGKFSRCVVRGAELVSDSNGDFWVNGANGIAYANDPRDTVEVWAPDMNNPKSNSLVDIKSLWKHGTDIIAVASLGGCGCVTPIANSPGCYRMVITKANQPLGYHIFNNGPLLDETILPTNPVEYLQPIKNAQGQQFLLGYLHSPSMNGFSELRPIPALKDWQVAGKIVRAQCIAFPFVDSNLWPTIDLKSQVNNQRGAQILQRAANLNDQINNVYGHLHNQSGQLENEVKTLIDQEQQWASLNGGDITVIQQQQLNAEADNIHNQIVRALYPR
jgi:hypothetical protein